MPSIQPHTLVFTLIPQAIVSVTDRDYMQVLMRVTLTKISSICQHTAISIPDTDKCFSQS